MKNMRVYLTNDDMSLYRTTWGGNNHKLLLPIN